jgi:hypothetical protein
VRCSACIIFTHSTPWNNWAQVVRLSAVWLFVCLTHVLTRDIWTATIINTSFATIGFVRNRVTTVDDRPAVTALALDALSIIFVARPDRNARHYQRLAQTSPLHTN